MTSTLHPQVAHEVVIFLWLPFLPVFVLPSLDFTQTLCLSSCLSHLGPPSASTIGWTCVRRGGVFGCSNRKHSQAELQGIGVEQVLPDGRLKSELLVTATMTTGG